MGKAGEVGMTLAVCLRRTHTPYSHTDTNAEAHTEVGCSVLGPC